MSKDTISTKSGVKDARPDELPAAPYPGLRPYTQQETKLFCGRAKERLRLVRMLAAADFLAVLGSSGSGKSSLVLSGLLPDIRAGRMPGAGSANMQFAIFRPGGNPYGHLARALFETPWGKSLDLPDAHFIEKQLRTGDSALARMLREGPSVLTSPVSPDVPKSPVKTSPDDEDESEEDCGIGAAPLLLIVVDQFEEIFRFASLLPSEQESGAEAVRRDFLPVAGVLNEAQAFITLLLKTVEELPGRVRVLTTMRSDFFKHCETFHGLPEAISAHQFVTPRMSREQMRDAIVQPPEYYEWTIDEAVVNELLNDLPGEFDQLPVLQHALSRMWHHARTETGRPAGTERKITSGDYEKIDKLAGAMTRHGKELLEDGGIKPEGAESFFRCLGDFDPATGHPIRRPRTLIQIAEESGIDRDGVEKIARVFAPEEASFIICTPALPVKDERPSDGTIIDLSHECLLRKWNEYQRWMKVEQLHGEVLQQLWRSKLADEHLSQAKLKVAAKTGIATRPQAWMDRYKIRIEDRVETPEAGALSPYLKKENHRRLGIRFGILGTAVCVFGLTIGLLISMAQSAKSEAAGAAALAEAERARAEAETARADAEKEQAKMAKEQAKMAKEQAKMASARFEAERKNAEVQARAAESAKNQEAQIGGLTTRIRDLESGTEDLKNIVTPLMKLVESSAEKPSPELLALLQKQGFTSGASQSPESSLTLSLPALADLNLSSWRQDGFGPVSSVALVDGSNSGEVKLLLGGRSAFWEVPLLLNEQGVISSAQKSLDLAGYKAWNQSVGSISVSTSHDSQDWYLVTNGGPDIGIRRGAAAPWETISTREQTRQAGVTRAKLVAGHKIVFGTGDGQLGWLDANKRDTPAKLFKSDHKGIINDLSMNPAGDLLLASGDDQMATLWQIMPEGALKPLSKVSCGAPVRSASFSPNGRWALIPSGEREIRLYLLAAAEPAFVESQSIALQHDMPVVIGSFSPDGRWIATATTQGEIRIWQSVPDPRPGKAQPVCTLNTAQRPSAMLWSPDGSILATADTGGNVALWQFQADGVLTAVPNFMPSMSAAVDALAWSPDGGLLIYGNSEGSAQVRQVGAFAAGSRLEDLQDGKRLQIAQTILEIEGGFPEDGNSKRDNLAVSDWVALLKKEELDREAEELPATLVLNVSDMVRRWLVDSYNTGRQGAVPLDLEAFLRCLVFRIGANPTAKLVQETLGMDADGVVGRATTAALRRAHDEDPNGYMQKLYEATLAYLQSKFGDSPSFASLTRQTQQMLDAAIALRQIPLEEQALIDRARSAIGKDTRYVLGKGGMRPLDPHPAQDGECDCSGFIAWVLGSSRQSKNEFYVKELEGWMDVTRMQKDILTEGGFLKPCAPKPGCFAAYGSGDESARNIALVTEVVLRDGKLVPSKVVGCTRNNAQTGDAILEYPADDFVKDPTTVYGELDPRLNALNGSLEMFLKENQPLLRQMIAEANIFAASRTISALIPLTETDAWLSIASDAQWGEDRSGHRDEHAAPGTRHLMPMPENLAAWLDEAVPGAGATMTTELNMRCWLRYLAIVKNKDVTGPPQHLHRGLFLSAGIAGNEVRQARLLTGVIHGHFLASAYRDEAPPVKALIQGYVSELTLPQLLEGTSYLHAGTPLISSRQTKLDQALGWLRASK